MNKITSKDCKKLREDDLGISQKDFAALCRVKQPIVSRWEKEGPVLAENISKLEILIGEAEDPEKLARLKKHIEEEGVDAVAPLLSCARLGNSFGKKAIKGAVAAGAIAGTGLFGAGLLALGGAYGTYKLLKGVFEPDEESDDPKST